MVVVPLRIVKEELADNDTCGAVSLSLDATTVPPRTILAPKRYCEKCHAPDFKTRVYVTEDVFANTSVEFSTKVRVNVNPLLVVGDEKVFVCSAIYPPTGRSKPCGYRRNPQIGHGYQ